MFCLVAQDVQIASMLPRIALCACLSSHNNVPCAFCLSQLRALDEPLAISVSVADGPHGLELLAHAVIALHEQLEEEARKARDAWTQLSQMNPSARTKRALMDLLGRCAELEKLLGLRDKQISNLVRLRS